MAIGLAAILVGCYRPDDDPHCAVRCAEGTDACPSSLKCNTGTRICEPAGGCDGSPIDAPDDDAPPSTNCHGEGFVRVCVPRDAMLQGNRMFSGVIDTTMLSPDHCDWIDTQNGVPVCVVAATNLVLGTSGTVAHGPNPIVFLGIEKLTINAVVSVSSYDGFRAAGSNPDVCVPGNGESSDVSSGGGAGGSFSGKGGAGGDGSSANGGEPQSTPIALTEFRGGCPGGQGGGQMGQSGGTGGHGGGAVYFLSSGEIEVGNVVILATGDPGRPLQGNLGGGGGGSGGFIGFDAPTIRFLFEIDITAIGAGGAPGSGPGGGDLPEGAGSRAVAATGNGGNGGGGRLGELDGNPGDAHASASGGGGGGAMGVIGIAGNLVGITPRFDPPTIPMGGPSMTVQR